MICCYWNHFSFENEKDNRKLLLIRQYKCQSLVSIIRFPLFPFHRLRILVNKKWGPSPETILQIYKQCVRPIFEYGIVSTITVSETVITKIQRVQNSFIRLALRLPKYVSARLLHEASGLPYVKERLTSVGQNHLARMHANPLVEHTINSAKTNIAWDKYKTPISILKPPDWSTDTDYKMQENEVTSANVQPLPWKW